MLKYLIEKEFKLIFRNSFLPRIIFAMPLMMMVVMPWAVTMEVNDIYITVIDHDRTPLSRSLIQQIDASPYIIVVNQTDHNKKAMADIEQNTCDGIVEIKAGFEKELITQGATQVGLAINAVNGMKGSIGGGYISSIIQQYGSRLAIQISHTQNNPTPQIETIPYFRFNRSLDYKTFMIPALIVMLTTLLAGFLPAFNIVAEKENGTIEQMNVSPVHKYTFILSKLLPYWIIGFIVMTIAMIVGRIAYGMIPEGNLWIIYLGASLFTFAVSSGGLIISNYSDTQQQALFLMFFFMLLFNLLSGLFTPIESMPTWAQLVTDLNPLKFFGRIMRGVIIQGSTLSNLWREFAALIAFDIVLSMWAIKSYRKRS